MIFYKSIVRIDNLNDETFLSSFKLSIVLKQFATSLLYCVAAPPQPEQPQNSPSIPFHTQTQFPLTSSVSNWYSHLFPVELPGFFANKSPIENVVNNTILNKIEKIIVIFFITHKFLVKQIS